MPTIFIPSQMRDLTDGCREVALSAVNVREAIELLEHKFPGIKARLCRDEELAPSLQVTVDGILSHRGLRATLSPASEVHFLPAIGGG